MQTVSKTQESFVERSCSGYITNRISGLLRFYVVFNLHSLHTETGLSSEINELKATSEVVKRTEIGFRDDKFGVISKGTLYIIHSFTAALLSDGIIFSFYKGNKLYNRQYTQ